MVVIYEVNLDIEPSIIDDYSEVSLRDNMFTIFLVKISISFLEYQKYVCFMTFLYLKWLKPHISDILKIEGFESASIHKILDENSTGKYSIRY